MGEYVNKGKEPD